MARLNVNAMPDLRATAIIASILTSVQMIQIYAKMASALITPGRFDANVKWALCIPARATINRVLVSTLFVLIQ